jgi:hypothetical protein
MVQKRIINYQHLKKKNGFAAITSMIVISIVVLGIATSVALMGIDNAQSSLSVTKHQSAVTISKSCVEEALIRIRDDVNYTGGSLNFSEGSCTSSVSGTSTLKTVDVVTTVPGPPSYSHSLQITVTRKGKSINITSWQEG